VSAPEPVENAAEIEADLRARVADTVEAMGKASAAGVNVQGVVMEMVSAAFAAEGEEVPPVLRMLLG
jgi:hypothetical protein